MRLSTREMFIDRETIQANINRAKGRVGHSISMAVVYHDADHF